MAGCRFGLAMEPMAIRLVSLNSNSEMHMTACYRLIYGRGGFHGYIYMKSLNAKRDIHRPHGDGLLVAGLFFTDYPPSWEKNPLTLLRTRGYLILRGNRGGSLGSTFDSGPMCCRFESHPRN